VNAWLKVTALLPGTPEDWSVWADRFARHGLEGTVQTDDPPTISAYVPPGEESLLPSLSDDLHALGARVETEDVEEVDWSEAWKQFFKPVAVGETLWIRPSWEDADVPAGRVEIVLDPGQAFGTGDHPTTRLCLRLLEECGCKGARVADIGCGSGILAIAAAKLGAASVDAVDSDAVAVTATRENAARNSVGVAAHEGTGFSTLGEATYGLVLSNIISAAVIGLAREAARRIESGGAWIVSGIIEPNWEDVLHAVTAVGFRVESKMEESDWVAAVLRR
jgi:ribosomal protein L11 methyltransferase